MKKTIFVLLLMVVIFSTTAFADYCGGTRRCHCGDILVESQVMWYDLIDCPDDGLIIGANDITLDCNNHLIDGDGSGIYDKGIWISALGTTLIDCNVMEFSDGIYVEESYNLLFNNNASNNQITGILLDKMSVGNVLLDNIVSYNEGTGIYLNLYADNNLLSANNINNNQNGIFIYGYNNTLSENNINNNNILGIYLYFNSDTNLIDNIITNNQDIGIRLTSSSNNDISGNYFNNNQQGVYIESGDYNTLWNNEFINNNINAYEEQNTNNNWNVSDVGNYWSDFESNPGYPDYYEIPGPGRGIDWHPIWDWPDVWITLMPTGSTTFPALGGILEYNITGGNYENETVILDVWVDVSVPGWTHPYGPVVGPVMNFNIPSYPWQTNINRELNIPARAPAGTYTLNGYLGEYDAVNPIIYAESHFNFIKEGTERDSKFKLVDSGQALE